MALEGAKRLSNFDGTKKKDPVTSTMLKSLYAEYWTDESGAINLRFVIICLIGFSGFLRIDELLRDQSKGYSLFPGALDNHHSEVKDRSI